MPKLSSLKWALVTGASSGIGEQFAYSLARRGLNLILVGRNPQALSRVGTEVHKISDSKVVLVDVDLTNNLDRVKEVAEGIHVDLLVNNAGYGLHGKFLEQDPQTCKNMIEINVNALVELSHHFGRGMVERGRGGIINISSVAGFFPIPNFAVYAATKAFVHSFSIALWAELLESGVHVLCVAPGRTRTKFFERAKMKTDPASLMDPKTVAEGALRAFEKDQPLYIPGVSNKMAYSLVRRIFGDIAVARFLRKRF